MVGWIVLILTILIILAVIGLGWDTFFSGVKQGAEKIGSLPQVKNLTDKAKSEFDNIIGNSSLDIIAITRNI